MKRFVGCVTAFAAGLVSFGASAQPGKPGAGWSVGVGGGVLFAPSYVGDDDYRLSALPNIEITYEDRFFASVQGGVGYNLINDKGLRVGPIARIQFSRDEDGSQPFAITGERTGDLQGLGDVDTTIELGGFIEYDVGPLELSVEARQGVNGHDGFIADIAASFGGRNFAFGPPLIYSIGPRLTIVDDHYNTTYFGVNAAQSIESGLPQFDASGGLYSYGVGASLILPLSRTAPVTAIMIAGYDRLAGDAGDAPLVQLRGSRNQASVGVFLSYGF